MLAKKTSKNQITLPKAIASHFSDVDYFEIQEIEGRIILEPARRNRSDEVRAKLTQLGISADDVKSAVDWAREPSRSS